MLPTGCTNGAKLVYACEAENLKASYTIYYATDMESQAKVMNAREFGGSGMASVTGSTTIIGSVSKTESLALRSTPEVADNLLLYLPRYTELIVYSIDENGWAYVTTPDMGTKGYVQYKYVKEEGKRLEVGNTFEDAPHYNGLADVKAFSNIYAEPNIGSAIIDFVAQGDKVSIVRSVPASETKYNEAWIEIQTESGIVGYIPAAKAEQSLIAGATVYAFHTGATAYVANTQNLRLRAEPNGEFIEWIPQGNGLTVIEDLGNGWVKVQTADGTEGVVMSRYLDSKKAIAEGDASVSVPGEVQAGYFEQGATVVVNSDAELNYREGPGYNFDKLNNYGGGLKNGTELVVVADDGYGWVKILLPETEEEVWVSRSFLAKPDPVVEEVPGEGEIVEEEVAPIE